MTTLIHYLTHSRPHIGMLMKIAALWLASSAVHAYTVEMSANEIQAIIAGSFPIKQQTPFFSMEISNPRVRIVSSSSRLRLALAIAIYYPTQQITRGTAEIEGELDYDAAKGEFHFSQPSLIGLEFNDLTPENRELITAIIGTIAQQRLPVIVLYRLDDKIFKQAMTRRMLKSITIKHDKIIAELDW